MKICLFAPTNVKIEADSIESRPLGGADYVLLKLLEHLRSQHEVNFYGNTTSLGRNFMDIFDDNNDYDVLIVYRKIWIIPPNLNYKKLIFYSQDTIDTPCFSGCKDINYFNKFDRIIVLSEFHKNNIQEIYNIPDSKIAIIGNFADKYEICEKTPFKFIYCSTPYRGLVVLMKMWKEIKERFPKATLDVFSSMKIYDGGSLDEAHFKPIYEKLSTMQGVKYHGSVPKHILIPYLRQAELLLYPNTYPETYCNVIMESRACHTPFITSDLGALKETGGKAGCYVSGNPYTEEYQKRFIEFLRVIYLNLHIYKDLQQNCYPIRTYENYKDDIEQVLK